MILVGITGAIGHGKTTFADFLNSQTASSHHIESSSIITEVANGLRQAGATPSPSDIAGLEAWLQTLPRILFDTTHYDTQFEQLGLSGERFRSSPAEFARLFEYLQLIERQPELQKTIIDAQNKAQFRSLLQWLGGYLAKIVSGQLWFDEIVRRARLMNVELVTAGGVRFPDDADCLRQASGVIVRIVRPASEVPDMYDVTEREQSLIEPDTTVINDASLEDLEAIAKQVLKDLRRDNLQISYQASSVTDNSTLAS